MISRPLPFFSSGYRLDADLYLPDGGGAAAPYPAMIVASGYLGLKPIHPERFARALTRLGFAILTFDYRGFGQSEGERGRLAPQDWAEDIRAGIDRLTGLSDIDRARIGLIGWALGGGVVVAEASDDQRVVAIASLNCMSDGKRSIRNMHDEQSWNDLLTRIEADRGQRCTVGRSEITSPWDIVRLDLDEGTNGYVGMELYKTPGYGTGVTLESAELLLRFSPQDMVHRLSGRPLLIMHGADNLLHRPEESQALYDHAREPKQLVFLEGAGHTEWMFDDDPVFTRVVRLLGEFFQSAMAAQADVRIPSHSAS